MSSPGIDPRAPRFGQLITTTLATIGLVLQEPAVVYLLTALLVVPTVSRWRIDPYRVLWQPVRRFAGPPTDKESPLPHRFARVLGAMMTTLASLLLLAASATGVGALAWVGYGFIVVVAVLAAVGAFANFCVGCRLYRQLSLFKRWKLLTTPAEDLAELRRNEQRK